MSLRKTIANLIDPKQQENYYGFYGESHQELAGKKVSVSSDDSSKPISIKTTPEISRVKPEELEAAYKNEPVVFNAINKTAQLIMAAGYKLLGDEESVSFYQDFFDGIGKKGGELEWSELLNNIFRHQMIYGRAWNEKIPAKRNKNKIVDLDLVDPKKMSYAKNANEKIVLDSYGNPVGYVETLPPMYSAESKYEPPEGVMVAPNQLFFPPDRVIHYKLYTIGDGFKGIGLIEPSYKTIVRKMSMEEALANALYRVGFPTRRVKVGDAQHEPTEEQTRNAIEQIKTMSHKGTIGHPYWIDLEMDEAKHPEKLQEQLNYFIDQIIAGTGLPRAMATGKGEATNRSTLNRQEALAKRTMEDIVRRTLMVLDKQLIRPLAEQNDIEPIKISWGEIAIEELDNKARRLALYQKAGLLTPDKATERLIRKIEDLPEAVPDENRDSGKQGK